MQGVIRRSLRLVVSQVATHRASVCQCAHSSTLSESEIAGLRDAVRNAFRKNPVDATNVLTGELQLKERAILVSKITNMSPQVGKGLTTQYTDMLFSQSDTDQSGTLSRKEMESLLQTHQVLSEDNRIDPPTREQLARVFTSNALPFIGFGFLDNFLMIVAGDSIDATVGIAFSLSTMAAAGLGNMVSDVAGIFCADYVKERAKVLKWGRMPSMSKFQLQLASVKYARGFGASIGVCIGCLLGMFPLLLARHHEGEHVHIPS